MTTLDGKRVKEEWSPVEGFEGRYEVSSEGRVKSLDTVVVYSTGRRRLHKGRMLRSHFKGNRPRVTLAKGEGAYLLQEVHRLVAKAFCEGWFEGAVVNHIDSNPFNNNFKNLEWCTSSQNMQHALLHGNFPKGEDSYRSILKEADVLFIRYWRENSTATIKEISELFGVSWGCVKNVLSRRSWKHV